MSSARSAFGGRLSRIAGLCVLTGCMLQAGCATLGTRQQVASEREDWRFAGRPGYKLTTDHYVIYTTVQDDMLVNTFPRLVETAYDYYAQLVPPAREPESKMPVYLFAQRAEWEAFTKQRFPRRAEALLQVRNGGYSEQGTSVIQYVTHASTFPLLSHEGFHQYLHCHVRKNVPSWLNEGLAVCCEGQRWSGNDHVKFDPWNNAIRRNMLAERLLQKRTVGLRELLRTHPGLVMNGPPSKVAAYYSQVWALALFLRESEYADRFAELVQHLGDENLEHRARAACIDSDGDMSSFGECLFRGFITDDIDGFEQEYVAFMRKHALGER